MPVLFSCSTDAGCTTEQSEFSPAGMLFRQPGTKNISNLFHEPFEYNEWQLLVFGMIYYMLACWCYGLGLPSGLFVPSLLTGATFGRLLGQLLTIPLGMHFGDETVTDA